MITSEVTDGTGVAGFDAGVFDPPQAFADSPFGVDAPPLSRRGDCDGVNVRGGGGIEPDPVDPPAITICGPAPLTQPAIKGDATPDNVGVDR